VAGPASAIPAGVRRSPRNPILTRRDVPALPPDIADVTSVFNPGAIRIGKRVHLLLRVQTRGRHTVLVPAESDDGERFTVRARRVEIHGLDAVGRTIHHVYDPRLTRIGDTVYMVFAADTDGGCSLGVAAMRDSEHYDLISFDGDDVRNGVLFPQRVGGRYLRLERPNRTRLVSGVTTGGAIVLAESDDLVRWTEVAPVMQGRPHYWDELIGSGPPPVKTRAGWLHVYHGIARHGAGGLIYQAGVCLLDLEDPARVTARGRDNVLEPREPYEQVGQVPNVVFPTGLIVDDVDGDGFALPDSRVRLYYGAADTAVATATTTIGGLIDACRGTGPAAP
jgi:beta-1,4-mannooligosaccharide/beta-1,4-mannosyl-N-acetylglucosamine phosphorylase